MVDAATTGARANGFRHVDGRASDVQSLPFADQSFDIVVANHVLYHVPDPDRAIAELARGARRWVVLTATNGYGHMREINDALAEVFGDHREQLYEVFGIDSGEARLRDSFSSVVWHAFDNDLIVDAPAPVVDYGLSFPPGETATANQQASSPQPCNDASSTDTCASAPEPGSSSAEDLDIEHDTRSPSRTC